MRFWLLDLNAIIRSGKPGVPLWGITEQNERVTITVDPISPYFYFLPDNDAKSTLKSILANKDQFPHITDASVEKRRLQGREAAALKISCSESSDVSTYARQVTKLGGLSFEPISTDLATECQPYVAITNPTPLGADSPPSLRVMAFAHLAIGERGFLRSERDPIRGLAVATSEGRRTLFPSSGKDDSELLSSFIAAMREFDPDIVVGH